MKSICSIHSSTRILPLLLLALVSLLGCKRETEEFETPTIEEMFPLRIGKSVTYRLDSLVFINAGKTEVTRRYQLRYIVEDTLRDNQNRLSWRINTYLNDSVASGPWLLNGFLIATPQDKRLEVTENNLRVIKIQLPVREGFTWKGNSFLPDRPYSDVYATTIDQNMGLWDFVYESVATSERIGTATLNDVTTILHIDEARNVPLASDTLYASRELSREKYAKNIGLVYREHVLWENQPRPRTAGIPPVVSYDPVKVGFGVRMWMIAQN